MIYPSTPQSNRRRRPSFSTPIAKRQRRHRNMEATHHGKNDLNDKAEKHLHQAKMKREPKTTIWDAKENPLGEVKVVRFLSCRQADYDQWGLEVTDDQNIPLVFFTPDKFKDAEAVCFNSKPHTRNSFQTHTIGTNLNFPTMQNTFVLHAGLNIKIKNVSQHALTFEIYICKGKETKANNTIFPQIAYERALDDYIGSSPTVNARTVGLDPLTVPEWLKTWDVERVTLKMEPGEHATHYVQGPTNYVMHGSKHVAEDTTATSPAPVWNGPEVKGNGIRIFTRMLNDLTFCSYATGGYVNPRMDNKRIAPHHPVNPSPADGQAMGGVICQFEEFFKIKAPEGLLAQQARHLLTDFPGIGTTIRDIQVDQDDPTEIITNPL